jgi:glycosyltransferase involved in cell wall biosynthesis
MKIVPHIDAPVAEGTAVVLSPVKVCMHVLGRARTDVRAMRAAKTLVAAGYSVSIVDIEGASECTRPTEDIHGARVKHITVSEAFIATRFLKRVLIRSARMLIRSALRLIQTPADIYHALDLPAFPACYIAARLRRKSLIFEAYELPLSTLPLSELTLSRRLLQALLARLLVYMVPRCAGVITVSPPIVQEMYKRYHIPKVTLIRNIPECRDVQKSDRIRQHLGLSPEVRIALYQGHLQPDRGLDRLVRTAAFLERNIVIVMMGSSAGRTQAQIEDLITHEGVTDRVKIIPPVPYAELPDWTSSADIGLIIYKPDYSPNVQMMLPNKLFEYLMAGLPVLASSLEAVIEIIKTHDVGRVLPSLAPADIGAAINTILTDQVALDRMHRNALEVVQQEFCWEKECHQLLRVYDDILATPQA